MQTRPTHTKRQALSNPSECRHVSATVMINQLKRARSKSGWQRCRWSRRLTSRLIPSSTTGRRVHPPTFDPQYFNDTLKTLKTNYMRRQLKQRHLSSSCRAMPAGLANKAGRKAFPYIDCILSRRTKALHAIGLPALTTPVIALQIFLSGALGEDRIQHLTGMLMRQQSRVHGFWYAFVAVVGVVVVVVSCWCCC